MTRARSVATLTQPLEEDEQRLYFQWLEWVKIARLQSTAALIGERLDLRCHCHAVPNQRGSRSRANNMILKGQGVTAGVSDISVLVPSGKYHGLFLEMKRIGMDEDDCSVAQIEQLRARRLMGYCANVVAGFGAARDATHAYLRLSWTVYDQLR